MKWEFVSLHHILKTFPMRCVCTCLVCVSIILSWFIILLQLLKVIKSHDNVCNHIHLPAQSGSTTILQKMRRGYVHVHCEKRVCTCTCTLWEEGMYMYTVRRGYVHVHVHCEKRVCTCTCTLWEEGMYVYILQKMRRGYVHVQ